MKTAVIALACLSVLGCGAKPANTPPATKLPSMVPSLRLQRTLDIRPNTMAFTQDGTALECWDSGSIQFWDVATAKKIRSSDIPGRWVMAFSRGGKLVATESPVTIETRNIRLWNVETGASIATIEGNPDRFTAVAFSPDDKILAIGKRDGTIGLWDVATGKRIPSASWSAEDGHQVGSHGDKLEVRALVFSADGRTLATEIGLIRLPDPDWSCIKLWETATHKYTTIVGGAHPVFSPDGKLLATVCQEHGGENAGRNVVAIWEVVTGKKTTTLTGHSTRFDSLAFSPDGKILAAGAKEAMIELWDLATEKGNPVFDDEIRDEDRMMGDKAVRRIAFSPDGKTLASSPNYGLKIKIWDIVMVEGARK